MTECCDSGLSYMQICLIFG